MTEKRVLVTGGSGFIGTAVVTRLITDGWTVTNVDRQEPKVDGHRSYWRHVDILDAESLKAVVSQVDPHAVVHLAARSDTESNRLEDYEENVTGTRNLLESLASSSSLQRTILTSTQFVLRPGRQPTSDTDFAPHTAYGESKVLTEQLLRKATLPGDWTIIRPTNIWGPWHPRYPTEFWKAVSRGWYLHPAGDPVPRSYGYVGNVAYQVSGILASPSSAVSGRVLYVGDPALLLDDWVNAFSIALAGRQVRKVPRTALKTAGRLGDVLQRLGWTTPPITSSRLANMTEPHVAPMSETVRLLGEAPYSMQQGVDETVEWLLRQGFPIRRSVHK